MDTATDKNTRILHPRAKINLTLDVTGRRADGYHLVRMIMQSVTLCDTIYLTARPEPGITLETDSPSIPADEHNLMWKAADKLIRTCGIREGIHMRLEKKIPAAAGLAGGSTDAAAVFTGMNDLFQLGLSREELMRMALPLGADIPYCILGGTALAEGIGEQLTPLPAMPACAILLARPDIEVSTPWAYRTLDDTEVIRHPDTEKMLGALKAGSLTDLASGLENVLEQVTAARYPVIEDIRQHMLACGAIGARMSGSGPTVFGIYKDKKEAASAAEELQRSTLAKEITHISIQTPT